MRVKTAFTPGEIALLLEALDSHEYWQLSDQPYRNQGFVMGKGSDDPEAQREIRSVRALIARLERTRVRAVREPLESRGLRGRGRQAPGGTNRPPGRPSSKDRLDRHWRAVKPSCP